MRFGQMPMHYRRPPVGSMRPGPRQPLRVSLPHHITLRAETAGDDHLAVLGQRFADRIQRFFHRAVAEAAGIDDHQIGILIAGGNQVALGAQAREDLLGIAGGLRAAERDEADFRSGVIHRNAFTGYSGINMPIKKMEPTPSMISTTCWRVSLSFARRCRLGIRSATAT